MGLVEEGVVVGEEGVAGGEDLPTDGSHLWPAVELL